MVTNKRGAWPYWLTWVYLQFGFRMFFRRNYLIGLNKMPRKTPVLVASNHPNSFTDPVFLGINHTFAYHYLARGDAFNKPLIRAILHSFNMLPIFRKSDDAKSTEKNKEAFQTAIDTLRNDARILIYPEGICVNEKKLRPLKRGSARLAIDAYKQGIDVQIACVGMNYYEAQAFRSIATVNIGESFSISEYADQIETNENAAVHAITNRMYAELQKVVVDLPNESAEEYHRLVTSQVPLPKGNWFKWQHYDDSCQKAEKLLADQIKKVWDQPLGEEVKSQSDNMLSMLKNYKLRPDDLRLKKNSWLTALTWSILLFPLAAIGAIFHLIPISASLLLTHKIVKKIEFTTSVRVLSSYIFYLVWTIILVIICAATGAWWPLLIYLPSAFFLIKFYDNFRLLISGWRVKENWASIKQMKIDIHQMQTDLLRVRK